MIMYKPCIFLKFQPLKNKKIFKVLKCRTQIHTSCMYFGRSSHKLYNHFSSSR